MVSDETVVRVGIVGLDTSHVVQFTQLLNDSAHPFHVAGARVTVAYPGGSPDFPLSYQRLPEFQRTLASDYGVTLVDSVDAVGEAADAVLLESVDGRVHLAQFARLAPFGKPVFIDKPLTVSSREADALVELAQRYDVPLFSASALRYAESLEQALAELGDPPHGADFYGPMPWVPPTPGWFWYGIHAVEMLYRALGAGCCTVQAISTPVGDLLVGTWRDGRIGTARGYRGGNTLFGGQLYHDKNTVTVDVRRDRVPYYARLLQQVVALFQTRKAPVSLTEMREVIRFLEAAEESRFTGRPVTL
ncbi:MAG: Gfo/Idh/MocA family oxidoreductase [Firmicutes bacterium]|nr:Gfo/Idh/MocA family oxidoreductase [Bacillota bacterium]